MTCPACDNRGWLVDLAAPDRPAAPCPACREARRAAKKAQHLERSGVRKAWQGIRLADGPKEPWQRPAYKAVSGWMDLLLKGEPPERGWLLWGPPGVGKSYLGVAALLTWWEATGGKILHVSQDRAVSLSYDQWKAEDPVGLEDQLRPYMKAGLMLLDEVGSNRPTEYVEQILRLILEARERGGRPLLAATNHRPEVLAERIGAPAYSRLMGLCEPLEMNGKDLRRERRTR